MEGFSVFSDGASGDGNAFISKGCGYIGIREWESRIFLGDELPDAVLHSFCGVFFCA